MVRVWLRSLSLCVSGVEMAVNVFGSSNKKKVYNTTNDYDQRQYHNDYNTDNSFNGSIDNSVTTLDGGAIKEAFGFSANSLDFASGAGDNAMQVSLAALDYYDRINSDSLATAEKATNDALSFAANASKADGLDTAENMTKYLMIGFAVLGAAMLFKKG